MLEDARIGWRLCGRRCAYCLSPGCRFACGFSIGHCRNGGLVAASWYAGVFRPSWPGVGRVHTKACNMHSPYCHHQPSNHNGATATLAYSVLSQEPTHPIIE